MTKSPQGPLGAFAGQIIGKKTCPDCGAVIHVKVNVSGWPYAICAHCHEERAQSEAAARRILASVTTWARGKRGPVMAAMDAPKGASDPGKPSRVSEIPEFEEEAANVPASQKQKEKAWYE